MKRVSLAVLLLLLLTTGAFAQEEKPEKDLGPGVSLTAYNENLAVVKERRDMTFDKGTSWVKFTDVASQIDPTSVTFASLTDPKGTRVVEQNYEFDLVSADRLLEKYIDRDVTVILQDGRSVAGTLMSSDAGQVILRTKGGVELVPRDRNVKDIVFSKLPEGLLTKPTLVWKVSANRAGKQLVKVAYMTGGVSWKADYTLELAKDEKSVNLAGWVTLTNRCGRRFENAGLKLIAGDVHRVREELSRLQNERVVRKAAEAAGAAKGVEERTFGEYHLYEVTAPTTINNNQTKQLEFVDRGEIPITKRYYFRPLRFGWWSIPTNAVEVEVHFKNDKASNLGIPLPKGTIRLYKRDARGELQLLGTDSIDHTPKDEEMKFMMGSAFDIVGARTVLDVRRPSERSMEEDVEITLRNHKPEDVVVTVEQPMRYGQWTILKQSLKGTKKDARTCAWDVPVKANSEAKVTYTVRYQW